MKTDLEPWKTNLETWKAMKANLEPWKTMKTMKNHETTLKNQTKTMKNHEITLKNQGGRAGITEKRHQRGVTTDLLDV